MSFGAAGQGPVYTHTHTHTHTHTQVAQLTKDLAAAQAAHEREMADLKVELGEKEYELTSGMLVSTCLLHICNRSLLPGKRDLL